VTGAALDSAAAMDEVGEFVPMIPVVVTWLDVVWTTPVFTAAGAIDDSCIGAGVSILGETVLCVAVDDEGDATIVVSFAGALCTGIFLIKRCGLLPLTDTPLISFCLREEIGASSAKTPDKMPNAARIPIAMHTDRAFDC
jgi:hypothetical protein